MKKFLLAIIVLSVLFIGGCFALFAGATSELDTPGTVGVHTPKADASKADAPKETAGQSNARQSAEDYLDYAAFSKSSLVKQLKYEGFDTVDAKYAARAVDADWNEQAARAAQEYLDYSSFSRSGLIEQLRYEGYTLKQATYGVDK